MKLLYTALILCILPASNLYAVDTVSQKEAARIAQEIGRFQLFQGQYTTYDLKKQQTYTHSAVFLLDTATGMVTRYVNKIDEDGKYTETWVHTDVSAMDKRK